MSDIFKSYLLFLFVYALIYVKHFVDIEGLINIANVLLWAYTILMVLGSYAYDNNKEVKAIKLDKNLNRLMFYGIPFALIYLNDIVMGVVILLSGIFVLLKGNNNDITN